jgi:hypothetical protein
MFPVYNGKCFPRKAVHNWVKKFFQGRSEIADDVRPGAKVAETTVRRLLCCGSRRIGKAMGQMYHRWWRIYRKINIFFGFKYHVLYVLYPFVTYLLTLPRMMRANQVSEMLSIPNIFQEWTISKIIFEYSTNL